MKDIKITVKNDCVGVSWKTVSETLKSVGMAYHEPETHRTAFEASHTTVFVYQAAVYDCAVRPQFQGKGIGKTIMNNILSRLSDCNVILYASPGKEGFYQTLGFRKMKTGMACFKKSQAMKARGFTE